MKYTANISYTVKHDLCTGCGICVSACPNNAIQMIVKDGRYVPKMTEELCKNGKGCHRCFDTCGGIGINLCELSQSYYNHKDTQENKLAGRYLRCFIGHSEDFALRKKAASGGTLSQFLIWLLENKKIDGTIVTCFDKEMPLKVKCIIARSKEEVLSSIGSKYGPVSMHEVLPIIKKSDYRRLVVVGLPCHVHSLRKLMLKDKSINEKIVGVFSLFCSGSQTINYTEYILKQCGGDINQLEYLAYREGSPTGMKAKGKGFDFFKEYGKYNMPLKSTFYPRRCLLCVDMFGELADINFGDIHIEDKKIAGTGINGIIVRSQYWLNLLEEAFNQRAIELKEISIDNMLNRRMMAKAKKERNASFVRLLHSIHIPAPIYDSSFNSSLSPKYALRYIIMRTKQYVGKHRLLWFLLPKIK